MWRELGTFIALRGTRDPSAHLAAFEKRRVLSLVGGVNVENTESTLRRLRVHIGMLNLRLRPSAQRGRDPKRARRAGIRRPAARGGNWRYRPKEGDLNFLSYGNRVNPDHVGPILPL